ncbi:MAG: DUF4404 family protein [Proteobacteria bacterium]|jgi:uncharacterized protein involved in exopolysaccharide biosynthesis|nr:DUF4404 family protein [Pseudomonadota bacterium]MBK8958376.1 DUF4404 family protein [Pseudomonadota bacterium]
MSREHLDQLLARLREELAVLEKRGVEAPQLQALVDDIERQVAADDTTVTGELKRRVEAFEVEHPRVTAILNDVMVTLSNLGI